jgi:hypothetical protein
MNQNLPQFNHNTHNTRGKTYMFWALITHVSKAWSLCGLHPTWATHHTCFKNLGLWGSLIEYTYVFPCELFHNQMIHGFIIS